MNEDSPAAPNDPAAWAEVKALFEAALALPPAKREALLATAPASEAVRAEVRSLLAHEEQLSDTWLAAGALAESATPTAPTRDAIAPGQRFGAWRIRRLLGSGGMGEVYEAERADGQFEGLAAIKLLKRGLDSQAVLDRFALERSALARLNHPHIARLYDAGCSDSGLPYFVMEYVDGQPIDTAARHLPLEGRLALFLQLTDAVAHAHRNLLLHRDLKPGNVLVTAEGQVKLLDFGIAKALDPLEDPAGSGSVTVNAPRPFTPQYASPEQVRGEPATTATDVYSLGVLLYELLTGVRPTGRHATSPMEAARSVLEEQPVRPSALTPEAGSPQLPDAHWLATRRRLQGDLDNVLLKALDKSREGRYLSVDAFAADIRAYLAGHPVSAQPPRALYLLSRFVRRHRVVVGMAALALVGILGGAALALWQAHEADRQRALAQQRFDDVRKLAKQLVFKYHDQIATLPGASAAREGLLKDAGALFDGLQQAALDDPSLAEELAGTWYRLSQLQGVNPVVNIGQHSEAEVSLDKALALTRGYVLRPGVSMQTLAEAISMHVSRGELWQARGELARADAALREGLPLLQRALERDPRDGWALASAVSLHGVHARILGNQMGHAHLGRWQDACAAADRARAAAEATAAADPKNKYLPDTLGFTMGEQAHCRVMDGRWAEADALFARSRSLRDQMSAAMPDDIDFRHQRAVIYAHQAQLWSLMGRHREALAGLDEARRQMQQAQAADAGNTAARRRLQALELFAAVQLLRTGDAAGAAARVQTVLAAFPAGTSRRYADIRVRAEALLAGAQAARQMRPASLQLARQQIGEAVALLQPVHAADDNQARRWLLGQALTEQAAIDVAAGDAAAAQASARAALAAFGLQAGGSATAALPPLLRPEAERAQALLQASR